MNIQINTNANPPESRQRPAKPARLWWEEVRAAMGPIHYVLLTMLCMLAFVVLPMSLFAFFKSKESVETAKEAKAAHAEASKLRKAQQNAPKEIDNTPIEPTPEADQFPGVVQVLGDRATLQDWGRLGGDERKEIAKYLAAKIHSADSPHAHRLRTFWYIAVLQEVSQRPEVAGSSLERICIVNDTDFADFMASQLVPVKP
jgi:hypothetical protein